MALAGVERVVVAHQLRSVIAAEEADAVVADAVGGADGRACGAAGAVSVVGAGLRTVAVGRAAGAQGRDVVRRLEAGEPAAVRVARAALGEGPRDVTARRRSYPRRLR